MQTCFSLCALLRLNCSEVGLQVCLRRCAALQALNDSGLGEALIGGGLMDELRQPVFSVGLKGVDPANADKVRPHSPALCLQGWSV